MNKSTRSTIIALLLIVATSAPFLSYSQQLDVESAIVIDSNTTSPVAGMIRWNATTKDFEGYNGTQWLSLTRINCRFDTSLGTEEALDDGMNNIFYTAKTNTSEPNDILSIELYNSPGIGSFTFLNENYSNCEKCALIYTGCTTGSCDKIFLSTQGKLVLSSVAGTLTGSLNNIELAEVTIDQNTFESTLVMGGETRCITEFNFSVLITTP